MPNARSLPVLFLLIFLLFQEGRGQVDSVAGAAPIDTVERSTVDSISALAAPVPDAYHPESLHPIATPLRKTAVPKGWFFLLNCLLLGLLVVKYTVFFQFSRKSWNAWINENLFFQLVREKAPVQVVILIIENLLKVYVLSALILLFLDAFVSGFGFTPLGLLKITGILAAFLVLKSLISFFLAVLTDQLELFRVLHFHVIVFSTNATYILVPLILVVAYLALPVKMYGVYLLAGVFTSAIIFLVFRTLRILMKAQMVFNLQFFLYLCGFEILPYLFLAKVLETNVVH